MALVPSVIRIEFLANVRFAMASKLSLEMMGEMTFRGDVGQEVGKIAKVRFLRAYVATKGNSSHDRTMAIAKLKAMRK